MYVRACMCVKPSLHAISDSDPRMNLEELFRLGRHALIAGVPHRRRAPTIFAQHSCHGSAMNDASNQRLEGARRAWNATSAMVPD